MGMLQTPKTAFAAYVRELQAEICARVEAEDGAAKFEEDHWERPGGGGGWTRVLRAGGVFEQAGVNVSAVHGELPDPIKAQFGVADGWFYATGISLVLHPRNPFVPTTHANFRYFELYDAPDAPAKDAWFGGGADLTPYYLFEDDARHFHQTLKAALDPHGTEFYPEYKAQCDAYFRNHHRNEGRGIGGTFYDYCRADSTRSLDDWFALQRSHGAAFLAAYLPIVQRRKATPFTDEHENWMLLRRGRYVEFNLVHDKGTLFGLRSNGRTESILMSLPPRVRWAYNHHPAPGTPEAELVAVLQSPRNWV